MLLRPRYELEGEPDGGGTAVADPPAPAAAPAADGPVWHTDPLPPATTDAPAPASTTATPDIDGAPATPPATPPVEGVAPGSESTDPNAPAKPTQEQIRAMAAAYRDELMQTPEMREVITREIQSGTDRSIQQFQASPQADEGWRELEAQAGTSATRLSQALENIVQGTADLDDATAQQIAGDTYQVVQYRTEQERRAHFHNLDTLVDQSVGEVLANMEGLDPNLLGLADQQSAEARDLYERMSKATDRNGRPDEKTRRQAVAVYNDRMLAAHANIWLAEGMRRAQTQLERTRQADLTIARETAAREAEARQQAGGGRPPILGEGNGMAGAPMTLTTETASTLSIKQLEEIRARQRSG